MPPGRPRTGSNRLPGHLVYIILSHGGITLGKLFRPRPHPPPDLSGYRLGERHQVLYKI